MMEHKSILFLGIIIIFLFFLLKIICVIKGYSFHFINHFEDLKNYGKIIENTKSRFLKIIFISIPLAFLLIMVSMFILGIYFSIREYNF
jgi:ABC-type spermidine/putrescine transport system permease subunit I